MNQTVIWSKDGCFYCMMAKQLLESKGIKYQERNISSSEWTREQLLEAAPGTTTVPQIFLYGKYIGGYNELRQYAEEHEMWRND